MMDENKYKVIRLFLIALLVRFLAFAIFYAINPCCIADIRVAQDPWHYMNHVNPLGEWWTWSPAYYLFTYIPYFGFIQILFSALAVILMYKMDKIAGWFWAFYPVDIFLSYQAYKEAVMIPLLICVLYLFRNKPSLRFIFFFLAILPFQAYGSVLSYNIGISHSKVWNFSELWFSPVSEFIWTQAKWLSYMCIPIYLLTMFYFIRHVKIISFEFAVIITGTIVWTLIFGNPRYREVFMPLIFLWYGRRIYYKLLTNGGSKWLTILAKI